MTSRVSTAETPEDTRDPHKVSEDTVKCLQGPKNLQLIIIGLFLPGRPRLSERTGLVFLQPVQRVRGQVRETTATGQVHSSDLPSLTSLSLE